MLPIGWEPINLLLNLNVSKSNLLLFNVVGNQPQTKFEIFIDHEQLKQKKCAKYLGLFIDNNHGKKGISKLLILN